MKMFSQFFFEKKSQKIQNYVSCDTFILNFFYFYIKNLNYTHCDTLIQTCTYMTRLSSIKVMLDEFLVKTTLFFFHSIYVDIMSTSFAFWRPY